MAACALVVIVAFGSACATTGSNYIRPKPPTAAVSSQSIYLKKIHSSSFVVIKRGEAMNITTTKGKRGPLVFYGADDQRAVIYAYGSSGYLYPYPVDDIQQIEIIIEGNTRKGAGWGSVAAGGVVLLFLAIGATKEDPSTRSIGLGFTISLSPGIVGFGSVVGLVVGGIMDIDERYPIGPNNWQIHIPASKKAPEVPVTDTPIALPETTPAAMETSKPKAEKPATEKTTEASEPVSEKPVKETKPDEKPKTVRDFLRKKKKEADEQGDKDTEPTPSDDP
jgi:hypothetical protein